MKEGRKELKGYGVIFTCLASQAIHIEVANSLNTDTFLNAIRRSFALHGPIHQLKSDHQTNFIGANNEIQLGTPEMDLKKVQNVLLKENRHLLTFKFSVPSASHMGGSLLGLKGHAKYKLSLPKVAGVLEQSSWFYYDDPTDGYV